MNELITVTAAILSLTATNAFSPSLSHVSSRGSMGDFAPMQMSSFDDDELSRLIGKRNEIKRKKREELPKEDDLLENLPTDPDSLDLEKMPEFKTKRTARTPKKSKEEDKQEDRPAEPEFNDYYADYVSVEVNVKQDPTMSSQIIRYLSGG